MSKDKNTVQARTTVIIPFHFRDHIENQRKGPNAFDSRSETTPVTLVRAWSQRHFIDFNDKTQPLDDELKARLEASPEWGALSEEIDRAFDQPQTTQAKIDLRRQLTRDLGALSASFTKLEIQRAVTAKINQQHLIEKPLWAPLEKIDHRTFNADHPKEFVSQKRSLVSSCREIVNDEQYTARYGNDNEGFDGLSSGIIVEGLSASMKRMWCVENREGDEKLTERPKVVDPLAGRCLTLLANTKAFRVFSQDLRFLIKKKKSKELKAILELSRVIVTLMPKNNGFCAFTFDITLPTEGLEISDIPTQIDQIQEALYGLLRARREYHLISASTARSTPPIQKRARALLPASLRDGQFGLGDLCTWLISMSDSEARSDTQEKRIGNRRKFYHHTSLHIPSHASIDDETLRRHSWSLRRASGVRRFPATQALNSSHAEEEIDLYDNLSLSVVREGTCALSWEIDDEFNRFGVSDWSQSNYHGIYLLFYLHIIGEESALEDFSFNALQIIEKNLSLTSRGAHRFNDDQLMFRDELKHLIYEMVYLNLTFNSGSAGGHSDYIGFMSLIKNAYSLSTLREELKVNIRELGDIVEQIEQERDNEHDRDFNRNVAIFGSITIPFGVFSGLMGMNNFNAGAPFASTPSWLTYLTFPVVLALSAIFSLSLYVLIRLDYDKKFKHKKRVN